ncbi:MAG: DUF3465 domain-containing protein [Thalassotalea sp.]
MKKALLLILLVIAVYQWDQTTLPTNVNSIAISAPSNSYQAPKKDLLQQAFENRQSDLQVKGSGNVIKILSDDNKGSRHQKFIIKLASGQTLLIAHNIDLAPRINTIANGDLVQFYGEYEWNSKGGVVHWTHHDPSGHHIGGWLKHNGRTYQ